MVTLLSNDAFVQLDHFDPFNLSATLNLATGCKGSNDKKNPTNLLYFCFYQIYDQTKGCFNRL